MAPEGATQAFRGGKQPIILPSYDNYESQQQPEWHNDSGGVIVAHIPW